jgi:toxin ParE1/3/4
MKYRVSDEAAMDLATIWRHVANESHYAADRLLGRFIGKFQLLAEHPDIGRRCEGLGTGMRRHSMGSYLIFYVRARGRIDIVRVMHGAQDWESLL